MSVYIEGLELPPAGSALFFDGNGKARFWRPQALVGHEYDVISVPPHGRLIDADAQVNHLEFTIKHCTIKGHTAQRYREMIVELSVAPTIIPAEVTNE